MRVEGDKVMFYVSTLLYLNVQPPIGPPDLSEHADAKDFPDPVRRHRSKSPAGPSRTLDEDAEASEKIPASTLPGPTPRRRHLTEAGLPAGAMAAVGSSPVPGSFVERLSRPADGVPGGSLGFGGVPKPKDKSIIQDSDPVLRRVVGPNPQFQPFTPTAGFYHVRPRVRFCRLMPEQWEAIRNVRRSRVPGLGDLWTD